PATLQGCDPERQEEREVVLDAEGEPAGRAGERGRGRRRAPREAHAGEQRRRRAERLRDVGLEEVRVADMKEGDGEQERCEEARTRVPERACEEEADRDRERAEDDAERAGPRARARPGGEDQRERHALAGRCWPSALHGRTLAVVLAPAPVRAVPLRLPAREHIQPIDDDDPLRFYYMPVVGRFYRRRLELAATPLDGHRGRVLQVRSG